LKKKELLITWPSHLFFSELEPIILGLNKYYKIVVGVTEDNLTENISLKLKKMIEKKILSKFFIIRNKHNSFFMLYKLQHEKSLLNSDFDLWISSSHILIYEKFISSKLIKRSCKRIIFWSGITYLLEEFYGNNEYKMHPQKSIYKRFVSKLNEYSLIDLIKYSLNLLKSKVNLSFLNKLKLSLISKYFSINNLSYTDIEKRTQISNGDFDALIFTDQEEVNVHKDFYDSKKVYLAKHPLTGNCKCNQKSKRKYNAIFSPLSGIINQDFIPKIFLDQYLKCFQIAIENSGATEVHLKKHPRDQGKWSQQLVDFLNDNGILTKFVSQSEPISNLSCDYLGVVGFASCALRDLRESCNNIFVIGMEEVSTLRYVNPIKVFGESQGISWIKKDFKYDKKIFTYVKEEKETRLDLSEILNLI